MAVGSETLGAFGLFGSRLTLPLDKQTGKMVLKYHELYL
jgi:hypothetical protein